MIWHFLRGLFSSDAGRVQGIDDITSTVSNPATGLPMLNDSFNGVDVGGSPYGPDIHGIPDTPGSGPGWNFWD